MVFENFTVPELSGPNDDAFTEGEKGYLAKNQELLKDLSPANIDGRAEAIARGILMREAHRTDGADPRGLWGSYEDLVRYATAKTDIGTRELTDYPGWTRKDFAKLLEKISEFPGVKEFVDGRSALIENYTSTHKW